MSDTATQSDKKGSTELNQNGHTNSEAQASWESQSAEPSAQQPAGREHSADTTSKPSEDAVAMILRQAGKSVEEATALSTLDDADRAADSQFSGDPPTITSLFGQARAAEFHAGEFSPSADVATVMSNCINFLMERKKQGTLCDHQRMLFFDDVITGLAERKFFGLAIPKQYGGSGAKLGDLGPLLRTLTYIHPDLAIMFEVHNFLGPVTPLLDFGSEEQKQHYLPKMAKGELLGSFALTELGVGADPSKLAMTAERSGDEYIINGVKWPITNVIYGGLCVLVVKLKGEDLKPGRDSGMILFEVPPSDNENFRMLRNDLTAFDYLWNARFRLIDMRVPASRLLGPPGRGLAQAFSSLAKGRGGIGVNSAAKIFKLLGQIILDPETQSETSGGTTGTSDAATADASQSSAAKPSSDVEKLPDGGGWTSFRATFGKPIGCSPRIRTWVGRAVCHGLGGRSLGDLCFRLAANGVRDETQGMIAKVYATRALLQTAINCYQILGGRSVHTDQRLKQMRAASWDVAYADPAAPRASSNDDLNLPPGQSDFIENFIGENMHEFTIATVYEGPNPVLADVGAPNAMTRAIRGDYLQPIGLAELGGGFGLGGKLKFGWYLTKTIAGSFNPWVGSLDGVNEIFTDKQRIIRKALHRNRKLGRQILLIIARYQKTFIDQSFLLGDEGGVFDKLCSSLAAMVFALSLKRSQDTADNEYLKVALTLDLEADIRMKGKQTTPRLQQAWAEIGDLVMNRESQLHKDLIADLEVSDIPLDPRFVDRYI